MARNDSQGITVTGLHLDTVPNPSCCSDPHVLCPDCALEALKAARQGGKMRGANDGTNRDHGDDGVNDDADDDDPTTGFQGDGGAGHRNGPPPKRNQRQADLDAIERLHHGLVENRDFDLPTRNDADLDQVQRYYVGQPPAPTTTNSAQHQSDLDAVVNRIRGHVPLGEYADDPRGLPATGPVQNSGAFEHASDPINWADWSANRYGFTTNQPPAQPTQPQRSSTQNSREPAAASEVDRLFDEGGGPIDWKGWSDSHRSELEPTPVNTR
jgi:hypothetical protein